MSFDEVRSGTVVESHAIILGGSTFKDNDKIVRLMTLDFGRISAIAINAQKSLKRFGAAIEPMSYVKAHLKVPRDIHSGNSALFRLEKVDLRDGFSHMRKSYSAIETTMFVLRLLVDVLPELVPDPQIFKVLGRFLRDTQNFDFGKDGSWARAYFWCWLTRHLGYGELMEPWRFELSEIPDEFWMAWETSMEGEDVLLGEFFEYLCQCELPARSSKHDVQLYQRWLELSGIHWEYFESWVKNRPHL